MCKILILLVKVTPLLSPKSARPEKVGGYAERPGPETRDSAEEEQGDRGELSRRLSKRDMEGMFS